MILITGGAGYIGSHLAYLLLRSGYKVVIIDNLSTSTDENLRSIERQLNVTIPFYRGLVQDPALLDQIFTAHSISVIIHLAGYKFVKSSVENPLDYYENNLNSMFSILRAMVKYNCYRLIFSSTGTIYGSSFTAPIPESSGPSPTQSTSPHLTSPYARTKLMIEQILFDFERADPRYSIIILRYFNPIGVSYSLTERPTAPENLMPIIREVLEGKRDSLTVYGNDYPTRDGTCIRDYIHIEDLVEGHLSALTHLNLMTGVEIFNLGTGYGSSTLEVLDSFARQGHPIKHRIGLRRSGDDPVLVADVSKAREILKWSARRTLDQMVKSVIP